MKALAVCINNIAASGLELIQEENPGVEFEFFSSFPSPFEAHRVLDNFTFGWKFFEIEPERQGYEVAAFVVSQLSIDWGKWETIYLLFDESYIDDQIYHDVINEIGLRFEDKVVKLRQYRRGHSGEDWWLPCSF